MASYWKSPYKEKSHSGTLRATFPDPQPGPDTVVALSSRPYCGLSKVRQAGPMSPQEWFDWALSVNNSGGASARPGVSKLRQSRAEIKGILKIPADDNANEDERMGNDTESNGSSRSEMGGSRREKKRVTFDERCARDTPSSLRYQTFLSAMSLSSNSKASNPLNGFPKKRSGNFPRLKKLPALSGEMVNSIQEEKTDLDITNSGTCKHSPELRCANCVPAVEKETKTTALSISQPPTKENNLIDQDSHVNNSIAPVSSGSSSWSKPGQRNVPPTQNMKLDPSKEKNCDLPRDPLKKYKPHWAKTFTRLQRKRQQILRLNPGHKNSYRIPNSISGEHARARPDAATSEVRGHFSEDFSKLHISGDGKVVRTKIQSRDVHVGLIHRGREAVKFPKTSPTAFPKHPESKTPPLGQSVTESGPLPRGSSAPGRLKDDSGSGQADQCMDKTSQILSWLDDVRSKSHFKPRDNRTYATDPTYMR
ncbi:hypothetical protein EGW08_011200 [Elysia chlorotica]|uniref:Uncharacterized protein n=1 Tax=Elysia chlorotica TaxID=188477 RepID=A0A3S0ZRH4_ELYCH|nr:hypothetical protein EGW08_011200 [Elysia chlorotica]